jgi:hypothetical protein
MVIPKLFRTCSYSSVERKISCPGFKRQGRINSDQCSGFASYTTLSCVLPRACGGVWDRASRIAGRGLPKRQQRLVEAWAELHQAELMTDWDRLQTGHKPLPIAPLT